MRVRHYLEIICGQRPYFLGNAARANEQNINVWYDVQTARIVGFGAGNPQRGNKDIATLCVRLDNKGIPLPELYKKRKPKRMEKKILRDIAEYRNFLDADKPKEQREETRPLF